MSVVKYSLELLAPSSAQDIERTENHSSKALVFLSDHDIKRLIEDHKLIIHPYHSTSINPSSIDLQLGSVLKKYLSPQTIRSNDDRPDTQEINIQSSSYLLGPAEFILGTTVERISIPDGYVGFIETKGNMARAGIQVDSNDGHIEPGFSGRITLEIKNLHKEEIFVELTPNTPICQLFIAELKSCCDSLYNGKYQNQKEPTAYHS